MRKAFLASAFFFLFLTGLLAQTDVERKLKQELWTNASAEFKVTQAPEKWKNEPAVILATSREYVGDMATKVTKRYYVEKINIHFRIKLQDKASVKEFSELAFDSKTIRNNLFGRASAYSIIGIKVIKANGIEKEVDLSTAVKTDAGSSKDLKIPIPNLEAGDILDYFISFKNESLSMPDFGDEDILEEKYPVVISTIIYTIPQECHFYSQSYNGAPEFKKTQKDRDITYTLKDEIREKAPNLIWNYKFLTSPHIRYRISTDETKKDFKKSAEETLNGFRYNMADPGYLVDFMEGNFKKDKSIDQKKTIQEMYYLIRNPMYLKAYFNINQGDPMSYKYVSDYYFFLINKFLIKKKIPHEIFIVPSRTYGPFADLINLGSCDLMVKVHTVPPIYITRPTPFSIPDEIPYHFEGMEGVGRAFASGVSGNDKVMRSSTLEENTTHSSLNLMLDPEDNSKINVKRSILAKGHNKAYHQYLVFTNYDYFKEYNLSKYQVQSSHRVRDLLKEYNKEKDKFEQRLTQDYNDRDTRIKNDLEEELDAKLSNYKNLSIKSIGMWCDTPNTEYSDEFTLEGLTKKAGPNLIFELGRLIEKQTEIKDEQKNRTRDIYMDYPRSYSHEISFTIPEGYTIEGIDNLNKKTETSLGGFVSSALVKDKKLLITTKKYYSQNHYPAADWLAITSFLNASVDFFNTKLLLKKQ
ncbi:MAG: DUF3857 domain-containing protein [Bacteroidota bacterium]